MKNNKTVQIEHNSRYTRLSLHRPEARNSLNIQMIDELFHALDEAEVQSGCRVIILAGVNGLFCTGMDFQEVVERLNINDHLNDNKNLNEKYMGLLERISLSSKIVISLVDGIVMAGGVGLVAASDLVIATKTSTFNLSEVLWGLLPAMLLPYLMRRVGFQEAYRMALTTEKLTANEAHKSHLVDELTENVDNTLEKLLLRLNRLSGDTIIDLKRYFNQLYPITETQAQAAIVETVRLMGSQRVKTNIKNFINSQILPWENHNL